MGPTGVGKTDLAIELYKNLDINIISVDSVQIYKHLNIGSGKPSTDVLKKYPHELIDILKPNESYSTSQFQDDVIDSIRDAFRTKRIPLLVGGTMMYFHNLINGISRLPSVDSQIRLKVKNDFEERGVHEMYGYLEKIDKNSSIKIHQNDTQRIKRAIEVFLATGKELSKWQAENKKEINQVISESNLIQIAIKPQDKDIHREIIANRFKRMIDNGLIEEVEGILERKGMSPNSQSMKSVGYRQVCEYLAGDCSLDDMIDRSINSTRQLAKRQMTWMRSWDNIIFLENNSSLFSSVKDLILKNS
jgi:tRNA dimethylallyltransferase